MENDIKDEVLMRCGSTFTSIERIIANLKAADPDDLKDLVDDIDIDFDVIRKRINKALVQNL